MAGMSAAQTAKMKAREAGAAAPSGAEEAPAAPASLGVMIGEGGLVRIGGREFEIAAVPLSNLRQVGELINKLPEILVAHALAASQAGGDFSAANTMGTLAIMMGIKADGGPPVSAITEEAVSVALASVSMQLDAAQVDAMLDLTLLVFSRRCPDVEEYREAITADLDIDTFLAILCQTFQRNSGLAKRF